MTSRPALNGYKREFSMPDYFYVEPAQARKDIRTSQQHKRMMNIVETGGKVGSRHDAKSVDDDGSITFSERSVFPTSCVKKITKVH